METQFKIEKKIKIPEGKSKYPFSKMKVFDSFIINDVYSRGNMTLGSNAARNWKKTNHNDWKFIVRKTNNDDPAGEGKIRIWRIK